jgi:oligoribonuclease NrnB/cAMP/cGMP phosphodiesterase (DHH superfamily)
MTKFKENRDNKREISVDKKIIVFYHKDCTDGFCGAWAAWKKFGDEAEYVALDPNATAPDLKEKEIYTIDMGFSAVENEKLIANNSRLTTIDHHISRKDTVPMTQDYSFDINHSGCVLAWKYFHPNNPIPKLLLQVEDFDLWRFNLAGTNEIVSFLDLYDFNFEIYSELAKDFEDEKKVTEFIKSGSLLSEHESKQVERIINSGAMLAIFEGIKTYVVNSSLYNSRIGDRLWRILPPMGIIWNEEDGKRCVSLRSNGETDVSILAAKHGGGGHKASAGFTFALDEKPPWEYINE